MDTQLPERNSDERPEFSQFPIIEEGENDGTFDATDRIIFYGNSPHKEARSGDSFIHSYTSL
ncbi:MAG: hypothetical protein BalsKO_20770 [Balneolaceae bacterium]